MSLRIPLIVLLALIAAIYPMIIYLGIARLGVITLATILLCVVILRMSLARAWRQPKQYPIPVLILLLCAFAVYQGSESALKYYPVMMNLAFAFIFASSLIQGQSLIEQIAGRFTDLRKKPPESRQYMRRLTFLWAAFLSLNGTISAYTACCMSTKAWAVYNSVLIYLLMGLFMAAELVFRHFFHKRVALRYDNISKP